MHCATSRLTSPLPCNCSVSDAVELQRGRQQHHRAHRLAQQLLHGGRIVLVFAQAQPGVRQAHGVAADRMPFEHEATDEIGLAGHCP